MNRTRSGFTLSELVMAMSVTLVIGLAVAGVAAALSNVHENSEEYYQCLQNGWTASGRLQATLRKAKLVLVASDDALALWASDQRDPGEINLSEIVLIRRDGSARQLTQRSVIFPDDMNPDTRTALDRTVALKNLLNAGAVTAALNTSPQYAVTYVLAYSVARFEVYPDRAAPLTGMVKFRLTVVGGSNGNSFRTTGGATLRASLTGRVGEDHGDLVLLPPGEN